MMSSDSYRQRSAILGLQVISKRTATRLGIITQIWLDVDQRCIKGVSVAERYIPGTAIGIGESFYMDLNNVDLLGPDAVLVDSEAVLEDILATERYTNLINNEVVTESGEPLGKVRDFKFDGETGELRYLILAAVGNPAIPASLISTYEVDVNEIIAVGRERIIVTEGMEDRMTQVTKGLLERIGLGKAPWEDEFEDDYIPPTTIPDALGSGKRSTYNQPPQRPVTRSQPAWDEEDNWSDERPARRQQRPEVRTEMRAEPRRPEPKPVMPPVDAYDDYDDDFEEEYVSRPRADYRTETRQQIREAWSDSTKIPDKSKQRIPEEELEEL
jgi:sporulation protein YlmC with PRC-barrel domain